MTAPQARDVVVIGAGQSGLATGYFLRRTGLDFEILDAADTAGGAWHHAWPSLRLFSPAQWSSLPGWPMPPVPDGYPGRDHVVAYLTAYERRYPLPVRRPVRPRRVARAVGRSPAPPRLRARLCPCPRRRPRAAASRGGGPAPAPHQSERPVVDRLVGGRRRAGGCDADAIAEAIRASRDARIKYVIWNRRIASAQAIGAAPAWAWRAYAGRNPHTKHVHVSVRPERGAYDSEAPWRL